MKDKRFNITEAIIINFYSDDIILTSGEGWDFGLGEDDWYDGEDNN